MNKSSRTKFKRLCSLVLGVSLVFGVWDLVFFAAIFPRVPEHFSTLFPFPILLQNVFPRATRTEDGSRFE